MTNTENDMDFRSYEAERKKGEEEHAQKIKDLQYGDQLKNIFSKIREIQGGEGGESSPSSYTPPTPIPSTQVTTIEPEETDDEEREPENSTFAQEEPNNEADTPEKSEENPPALPAFDKQWKLEKAYRSKLHQNQQSQQEINNLQGEVQRLKSLLVQASDTTSYHWNKSLYQDLAQIKQKKEVALATGNKDALFDADVEMFDILQRIREAEQYKDTGKNYQQNQAPVATESYQEPEQEIENEDYTVEEAIIEEWIEDHPQLNASSQSYNPRLTLHMQRFITDYDNYLSEQGYGHMIYSGEYLQVLENEITKATKAYVRPTTVPKAAPAPTSHVGGVRNVAPSNSKGRQSLLGQSELNMIKNFPSHQHAAIKAKWEEIKLNKQKK